MLVFPASLSRRVDGNSAPRYRALPSGRVSWSITSEIIVSTGRFHVAPFESLDHRFNFHYAFRPPPRPYSRRHEKAVKRPQGSHKDSSERARTIAWCTTRWRRSRTGSRVYSRIAGLPSLVRCCLPESDPGFGRRGRRSVRR